jgi:polysaccharide pyruvyl transferase CsaB
LRIVISGYYGFGNVGDEAMLAGLLQMIRDVRPGTEMTVLSAAPGQTESVHAVRAVSRWNPTSIVAALRRSDALVSGGGGLLQDVTSARPIAYYAGIMELAGSLGRPYVILAQGLGPIHRRLNRRLAARALTRAAHVSLRDDESIALARQIGVRRPIDRAADPAIALAAHPTAKDAHVLVAPRGGSATRGVIRPLRDAVREVSAGSPVLALPMDARDADISASVVAGIAGAQVVPADAGLETKLDAIASARVVIGVRLHALILAAAAGVPAVAISYDPKVDAFARRAGIPVAGTASEDLRPDAVLECVRQALEADPEPNRSRVDAMRAEARQAVAAALASVERA